MDHIQFFNQKYFKKFKEPCVIINLISLLIWITNKFIINIYIPLYFNNHGNSSYVNELQGSIIEIKEKI